MLLKNVINTILTNITRQHVFKHIRGRCLYGNKVRNIRIIYVAIVHCLSLKLYTHIRYNTI